MIRLVIDAIAPTTAMGQPRAEDNGCRRRLSGQDGGNETEETTMSDLDDILHDLVVANRILAHQNVVDAYGHVSVRHPTKPDRFFLSRSRSPELVTRDDILEFDLDCNPIDQRGREI
jgi:hypothetical protein